MTATPHLATARAELRNSFEYSFRLIYKNSTGEVCPDEVFKLAGNGLDYESPAIHEVFMVYCAGYVDGVEAFVSMGD